MDNRTTFSRFPSCLLSRIREKGIGYCLSRVLELTSRTCEQRSRAIRVGLGMFRQQQVLFAFYDLAVSPPTFDIVIFLILAEIYRIESGCIALHVVIVPGPKGGFRPEDVDGYQQAGVGCDHDWIHWRLRSILTSCCWLMPSCAGVTVCATRKEAMVLESSLARHSFPKSYQVTSPRACYGYRNVVAALSTGATLPSIRARPQARHYVSTWMQTHAEDRKVIGITLRECRYSSARNSSLRDWSAFARSLDPEVYYPVFVRDTDSAFDPCPDELCTLNIFAEASWNVELRAALYELCYLNLGVNNGPGLLFMCNGQTRYLYFKLVTRACGETEEYFRAIGWEPGSQFKMATPFQRCVWQDDRIEVIQDAFEDMCRQIERAREKELRPHSVF